MRLMSPSRKRASGQPWERKKLGELVEIRIARLAKLRDGKDDGAVRAHPDAIAVEVVGRLRAKGRVNLSIAQQERAGLDGEAGMGGQLCVFLGGDDVRAMQVDVEDTIGLEEEIPRRRGKVEGMESFAVDDAETGRYAALLEDPGIHDEGHAPPLLAKVLLESAKLAEGFSVRPFPEEIDLGGPGLVGEKDGAAALDALLGGEERGGGDQEGEGKCAHGREIEGAERTYQPTGKRHSPRWA